VTLRRFSVVIHIRENTNAARVPFRLVGYASMLDNLLCGSVAVVEADVERLTCSHMQGQTQKSVLLCYLVTVASWELY